MILELLRKRGCKLFDYLDKMVNLIGIVALMNESLS